MFFALQRTSKSPSYTAKFNSILKLYQSNVHYNESGKENSSQIDKRSLISRIPNENEAVIAFISILGQCTHVRRGVICDSNIYYIYVDVDT